MVITIMKLKNPIILFLLSFVALSGCEKTSGSFSKTTNDTHKQSPNTTEAMMKSEQHIASKHKANDTKKDATANINIASSVKENDSEKSPPAEELKSYHSEELECGSVKVSFEAKCYDELEGTIRGSDGGTRNYCESIVMHINGKNVEKTLKYPMMPNNLITKLKKDGYHFKNRVDTNDWTPQMFSCLTFKPDENYILITYENENKDSLPRNALWESPIALNLEGKYVDQEKQQEINSKIDNSNVLMKNKITNIIFLGE